VQLAVAYALGVQGCAAYNPVKLNKTLHFPDGSSKGKLQKSWKDNFLLSSPGRSRRTPYVLRCSRAFAVVSSSIPGMTGFTSLFVYIYQPWVCAIPGAHLLCSTTRIQRDTRADCFCSCTQRCCRAECVSLVGFNVQSDIFAVMIAWS